MRASLSCMAILICVAVAVLSCAPLAARADLPLTEWVMTVSAPTLDVSLTINNTQFVNASAVTMGDRRTLTYTVQVPVADPLLTLTPNSTWVWQRGSQKPNISAWNEQVYLRIIDQTMPASRRGAAQFKDGEHNMWIYGGQNPSGGRTADFYRYNRQTNQFTLFSAGLDLVALTDVAPVYRNLSKSDPATSPGSRSHACVASNAMRGEFWMYGGKRNDATVQADLFRFASANNEEWTWVAGNQSTNIAPVYPAAVGLSGGYPGSRYGASCWTSTNGMRVFLYGGFDATDGLKSDLWMWNVMDSTWTWLSGSNSAGTLAATDAGLTAPLPRGDALAMGPDLSGRYYLAFGQACNDVGEIGAIGDLWRFTLTGSVGAWVTTWSFVKGSRIVGDDSSAVFGALGVAEASLQPGARSKAMGDINRAAGHLIISGGLGFDAAGSQGLLADVWQFDISSGLWRWLSGGQLIDAPAVFPAGAGPVSALATPGARCDGAGWVDGSGSYFTGFGSVSTGAIAQVKNDLWRLAAGSGPVSILITPTPSPAYISSVGLSLGVLNTHYLLELPTIPVGATGVWSSLRFMVTSPGSSCPDFTLILVPCARNTNNSWVADVSATGRAGVTTLSSESFTPEQGVFALPASAAFGQAVIDFKLPNGATLSPLASKHAVLTLPNTGANVSYPFRVISQSGLNSSVVELQFQVAPSSNNFWQALVTLPGGATVPLSSASTAVQGQFVLPTTAAGGMAFVSFLLPYGAQVVSATALAPIQLGSTDSTVISTFFVQAQDGTASAPFNLQFHVAPSEVTSWSALVAWNQPGVPRVSQSVSSATASPTTVFHLPLSVLDVVDNAVNISLTLAEGASLGAGNPLSVLLSLAGKLPGDSFSFAFHVEAQAAGVVGANYTLSMLIDSVPSSTAGPSSTGPSSTGPSNSSTGGDFVSGSSGPNGGLTLVSTTTEALSDSQLAGVIAGSIVFLVVAVAAGVILYKACCIGAAAGSGSAAAAAPGAAGASGGAAAAGAPSEIPMAQL